MVSFLQVQCLNCGTVDDVVSMGGEGEASWCSQCGFTRRTTEYMSQERQVQQQLLAEDEHLAALLSKNMWLSETQTQQPQQQPAQAPAPTTAAPAAPAVVANPGANISISQHYHHYRPIVPPPPAPAPAPAPTQAAAPSSPTNPTYLQHLLTTSSNPEAALQDYHRHLNLIEEQYHHRVQQQQTQQYPPSPTGSTVSSIQDDHQLQMILLEQHNVAQEAEKLRLSRAREEEQMIFNQLMTTDQRDDVMSDDEVSWTGGQPMPNLFQQQQQYQQQQGMENQKVVYPVNPSGQPWVAGGEEQDPYGMDDEESPCVTYYSRVCYANYL